MNKNINKVLANEKGLIVNEKYDNYIYIENLYKYLFECYLLTKVNIKKYDDEILNSNLYFGIPHPTKEQLINGLNEYFKFNYIYVLNNFFIEKLSIDDLNKLKEALKVPNLKPTKELLEIVSRTYKEVIKNNYTSNGYSEQKYQVCYGYMHPGNFADNDALVLKIFYSKNSKELNNDEFIKNLKEKKVFLNNLIERIITDINNKLDINIRIIEEKIPN